MRTLVQVLEDFEKKNYVKLGTATAAKRGERVRPGTARQLAKAFGATDEEADAIEAQTASQAEGDKASA